MNNTENTEPQDTFQVPEPEPEYTLVKNIDPDELKAEIIKLQRYQNGTKNNTLKPWRGQILSKDLLKLINRLSQPKD